MLLTWDAAAGGFWLVQEYFPEFLEVDRRRFPAMEAHEGMFGAGARVKVTTVPLKPVHPRWRGL